MAERLTDEEIQAMRARCEAATPGPWTTTRPEPLRDGPAKGFSPGVLIAATSPSRENRVYATPPGGQYPSADQRFIAHARTDLPRALDEIGALRDDLAAAAAREVALAEALRRAGRQMDSEADSLEACDMPAAERIWRDEAAAVEEALADPSPAAKRLIERVAHAPELYEWGGGAVPSLWTFGYWSGRDGDMHCLLPNATCANGTDEWLLSPACDSVGAAVEAWRAAIAQLMERVAALEAQWAALKVEYGTIEAMNAAIMAGDRDAYEKARLANNEARVNHLLTVEALRALDAEGQSLHPGPTGAELDR